VDEDEALAICFANLKGHKDKNLIDTAKALQYLKGLPQYGSNQKVGEAVGVSAEVVREFLTLLSLPKTIQSLFEQRQLKRLEQSRRLWQLARHRPGLLEETAITISDLSAWDGRHVIDYIIRNPGASPSEARKKVIESKTIKEREYHVIAILSEEEYRKLAGQAHRQKVSVDVLVSSIVHNWLESQIDHS